MVHKTLHDFLPTLYFSDPFPTISHLVTQLLAYYYESHYIFSSFILLIIYLPPVEYEFPGARIFICLFTYTFLTSVTVPDTS